MELNDFILNALLLVITTFIPIIGALTMSYLKKVGAVEVIKTKEMLVKSGVEFAEQAYWDLGGPHKYELAVEWIVRQFNRLNLSFTKDEVKGLVESAVYEMQKEWMEVYNEEEDEDFDIT